MSNTRISRTYTLRRLENSRDPDYAAGLNLYVTNVAPDISTSSNEITYWTDRSYTEFKDEFSVLGFYSDRKLIGFAQLAFFRKSRVLFFDYIVLHRSFRAQGEYFEFARMLQEWVDCQGFEFDYAAAEVSFEVSGDSPSHHSVQLVHLFKQMGFGVAQCPYYQPPLGYDNPQSDIRAHLLLASRGERLAAVKRETLLHVVRTIYFNHYRRWYEAFFDDIGPYHHILERRFADFESCLPTHGDVVVNGFKQLNPPLTPAKVPTAAPRAPVWIPLVVFFAIALVCGGLFYIQSRVQLHWLVLTTLFVGTLTALATAFAVLDKDTRHVLQSMLDTIVAVFDKRK